MLTPRDFGLPSHFTDYRPGQLTAALNLIGDGKRFSLISASTGSGKSLIGATISAIHGGRTLTLTHSKNLQDQLMNDFHTTGMRDVRGAANYRCGSRTCEDGELRGCISRKEGGCDYLYAQAQARASRSVNGNYALWLALSNVESEPLGRFDLLVCDEAHAASDLVADFMAIDLTEAQVGQFLGVELPDLGTDLEGWSCWADDMSQAASNVAHQRRTDKAAQRFYREIVRLAELDTADETKPWVVEATSKGMLFSPLWPQPYAEGRLFRHIPKIVLMSATLLPDDGKYLGIDPADSTYSELPSTFDPARRPFYFVPTCRVDRRMTANDIQLLVSRIDNFIGARLDRKGVIQCTSYEWASRITSMSRYREHMIEHTSRTSQAAIATFKQSPAPKILVSPSVEEGYDFADDTCRYQVLIKIPFADTRSAIMKARCKDKGYANHLAARSIVQRVGRSTRSETDWSESITFDSHWSWFRNAAKWPAWFRKAWVQTDSLPAPLNL